MKKSLHYVIFKNQLGYLALVFSTTVVRRIYLPFSNISQLKKKILADYPEISPSKPNPQMKKLMHKINLHLGGEIQTYHEFKIDLCKLTSFQQTTLLTARKIKSGKTLSYKALAETINSPKSYRAVGSALSQNPLPLIIPCHRIVSSKGIGGFTAELGIELKKYLLRLENHDI